jgi:hypothetical protein
VIGLYTERRQEQQDYIQVAEKRLCLRLTKGEAGFSTGTSFRGYRFTFTGKSSV